MGKHHGLPTVNGEVCHCTVFCGKVDTDEAEEGSMVQKLSASSVASMGCFLYKVYTHTWAT